MIKMLRKFMDRITIGGVVIDGARSIHISGRRVTVDGDLIGGLDLSSRTLEIRVEGNLTSLTCDGSATVEGDVLGALSSGGSVRCGNVGGSAKAGGSIRAASLQGSANAGGSIKIG